MKPLGLSQKALARELAVPPGRIGEIVNGRRSITGDTALRLARHLRTSPEFWMNLQAHVELETAQLVSGREIRNRVRPRVDA